MNSSKEIHDGLVKRIAEKYTKDGYQVYITPETIDLPFDLGYYRPDLLVKNDKNQGFIIEIKNESARFSVDRLRDIAENVAQHQGWRFLLVTGDDISQKELEYYQLGELLNWEQIFDRKNRGEKLLLIDEVEGAFLIFWGTFESLIRKQAEQMLIPIKSLQVLSLIKHLYSQGELSFEKFDSAMNLINVRNQLAHGFQVQGLKKATLELQQLISELLNEWYKQHVCI